jgi:hypothetical protein
MKYLIWNIIFVLVLFGCSVNETPSPTNIPTSQPSETITLEPSETATQFEEKLESTNTPTVPTKTEKPVEEADNLLSYPEEGYGPVNFPDNINPLTGLPVEDPGILDRHPVAVKISNYPREIRPQWGLSEADHVFEYYHEGGLTRYHAIFYGSDVEEAGPIRSARFPDEHLIRAYKSVFAFGSADFRVRWKLFNADFSDRLASISDKPCPPDTTYPTCRIDQDLWNHLMTDTSILSQHFTEQGVQNERQNLDGLFFQKQTPNGGENGTSLVVRYSSDDYHKWEYESTVGQYIRYHDLSRDTGEGETYDLLVDRTNDEPITADNVVILFAPYSFYSREPEIMLIDLIGVGKAYVFRDGQAYDATWARANNDDIISITYADGSRFPLKPGKTWFDIIGQSSPITDESPNFRFQFQTP